MPRFRPFDTPSFGSIQQAEGRGSSSSGLKIQVLKTMMPRLFLPGLWFVAAVSGQTIAIRAGTVLDGKGGVQKNVRITIQGSRILRAELGGSPTVDFHLYAGSG